MTGRGREGQHEHRQRLGDHSNVEYVELSEYFLRQDLQGHASPPPSREAVGVVLESTAPAGPNSADAAGALPSAHSVYGPPNAYLTNHSNNHNSNHTLKTPEDKV
ncbi:hypothetical protein STCU_10564 [Strigomonas culicis]|uniref:Uncharacterized protein n=1 Tax=Strigomonas culicis TaxID=28005 RepID=S9USI7_9TRYP|nr:hypothetical protein STCU_10564 [Strigomonas culicis]|eukprot:EPY17521.1 hypothetical protein STCU_10564 [Strigomonas culicis]